MKSLIALATINVALVAALFWTFHVFFRNYINKLVTAIEKGERPLPRPPV